MKPAFYVPWIYTFHNSMYVCIGVTKTSRWQMLNFTKISVCPFYPIPCFTFKSGIHLATAVILSTFSWKSGGEKHIFTYNFLPPLLYLYTLTISWFQGHASSAEPFFPPVCVVMNDLWWVTSDCRFHVLIRSLYKCCSLIYCEMNWQTLLFYFLVAL
jgi:hypothetical protein